MPEDIRKLKFKAFLELPDEVLLDNEIVKDAVRGIAILVAQA